MHFSEDDLREAFKRKDPGEGFTQRLMARVGQAKAEGNTRPVTKKVNGKFLLWWRLRPAMTFAVVALLLLGFAWAGFEYSEHRHEQTARKQRQQQEEARRQQEEDEHARDQAILALRIARSKMNHVLEQAQIPVAIDQIRRQRL